ncbi:MAG TPA: phage major capsid protein [Ruminococcaceae bacterium]|nr:phage major capsid protein [Oscillospiraceae bacterium]
MNGEKTMPMKSKDLIAQQTKQLATALVAAMKSNDENAMTQAFADFTEQIQQATNADIATVLQSMDSAVLANRGIKQLTSEEKDFFQKLLDASASVDPRQAIADIAKTMPETIIDTVLEEIKAEHPLLDAIDFVNTNGRIKMIYNSGSKSLATWDELNTAIVTELAGAISTLDMTFCKLTACLPVPKDMIDLGPAWLLTLTVSILSEALADGLENAIIAGDGNKKPIGMLKDLAGAVVNGIYPDKTAVVLKEITPKTYNAIIAQLAVKPTGGYRKIPEVILVCNPADYLTKVLPATTVLTTEGTYRTDIFPYPTKVVQSAELPAGTAVIGIASKYFMGIGNSKTGKIEYDDSVQFLADNRVYKIKLYGNGRPKDNNAFIKLDISGLAPSPREVKVVNSQTEPVNTKAVS